MWGDTRFLSLECPFTFISYLVGAQSSLALPGYVWLYIGLLHHALYPVFQVGFFSLHLMVKASAITTALGHRL